MADSVLLVASILVVLAIVLVLVCLILLLRRALPMLMKYEKMAEETILVLREIREELKRR